MDIQSFIANFEQAIDAVAQGDIIPETEFQKLPQWDSIALLNLMAMIDTEYEVEVSAKKITGCRTIQDLFDCICTAK